MTVKEAVDLTITSMGQPIRALLINKCPAVLSMGRRCMLDGWDYIWIHNTMPYYQKAGQRIYHTLQKYCPVLRDQDAKALVAPQLKTNPDDQLQQDDGIDLLDEIFKKQNFRLNF